MKPFLKLAIACVLIMHARAADGWDKVKWGMTRDQVRDVYPEVVRPNLPPELQSVDYLIPPSSTLGMMQYRWLDLSFSVTFVFNHSERLDACWLMSTHDRKDKALDLRADYERVMKELSKVHGKSKEEGEWLSQKTVIRSALIFADEPQRTAIVVRYSKSGGKP